MLAFFAGLTDDIRHMGKVYSPSELAMGQVPLLDSFERVAHEIMQLPSEADFAGLEIMIHGSVDERAHNVRSDVDCLMILPDSLSYSGIAKLLRILRYTAEPVHVPLEPVIVPFESARHGYHGIDPMFSDYLHSVEPNVRYRVGLPASKLATVVSNDYLTAFHTYLASKAEKFAKAVIDNQINYSAFQRSLELPRALQRKYDQFTYHYGYDGGPLPEALANVSQSEKGDYDNVIEAANGLIRLDEDYNDLLLATLEDPERAASSVEYEAWINASYPVSVKYAALLSLGAHALVHSIQ